MPTRSRRSRFREPQESRPTFSAPSLRLSWLPFFTATNTMGDTAIPHEALGAPLRLGYNADGSVKFTQTGRPAIKVAEEIQDNVRMVRENFVAGLMAYANGVASECPEGEKAQAEAQGEQVQARHYRP